MTELGEWIEPSHCHVLAGCWETVQSKLMTRTSLTVDVDVV